MGEPTINFQNYVLTKGLTLDISIQVMLIILIIWIGIALFLSRIDRRISKLEKKLNAK